MAGDLDAGGVAFELGLRPPVGNLGLAQFRLRDHDLRLPGRFLHPRHGVRLEAGTLQERPARRRLDDLAAAVVAVLPRDC